MAVLEYPKLTISKKGTLPSVPFLAIKNLVLGKKYDLSVSFVGPKTAQDLNIKYRNKDYIPNTLSFSLNDDSGEIILCMEAIKKEYKKFDMDLLTYISFLVIHSSLHLIGYEHGCTMEDKEQFYLAKIKKYL